eukprot:XP_001692053.1 hypothetical protein CHLREDRAFT_206254 [Chlamydomonas reinhardtii]
MEAWRDPDFLKHSRLSAPLEDAGLLDVHPDGSMGLRAADKERLAPGLGSGQADVLGVGLPGGGTLGCSVGFRLLPSGAWELTGRWHAMQQDLVQISAAHVGPGNAVLARASSLLHVWHFTGSGKKHSFFTRLYTGF